MISGFDASRERQRERGLKLISGFIISKRPFGVTVVVLHAGRWERQATADRGHVQAAPCPVPHVLPCLLISQ